VLGIIHEHAFSSSDFPLILVIRVRATESGQLYLAEQLHEYLGDSLCTAEQINTTVANLTPEKLKNKILLELSGRSQDDLNLSHRDQLANSFINYITYSFAHRLTKFSSALEIKLIFDRLKTKASPQGHLLAMQLDWNSRLSPLIQTSSIHFVFNLTR